MAYARWSDTNPWYIFWDSSSGDTKDEQVLSCWNAKTKNSEFTYKELSENRDKCFLETGSAQEDRDIFDMCVDKWMKEVDEEVLGSYEEEV